MFKRIFAALLVLVMAFSVVAVAEESGSTKKGLLNHSHIWSPVASSDTATCTKEGVKTYKCINIIGTGLKGCQEVKTEVSPAKGHQYITTATAKATCEKGATETKYCLRCKYTDVQTVSQPLGHKWDGGVETGTVLIGKKEIKYTCETCGKTKSEWVANKPAEHHWGDWVVTTKAKCETEGERTRYCTDEGCEVPPQTEKIPALGHDYLLNGLESVQPTCEEDGKQVGFCTRCFKLKETVIPALGHEWNDLTDIVPTCTEPGFAGKRCERCGLIEYGAEIGKPLGHDYKLTSDTSTCVLPGIRTYTCTHSLVGLCNEPIKIEVVPAKGHTCDEWDELTAPSCEAKGKCQGVCENCGQTYTFTIPALGHDWDYDMESAYIKPTCTEAGWVKDAVCLREGCGKKDSGIFNIGKRVEPLGHDWSDEGVVITKPTCTEKGVMQYTCEREGCGATREEDIAATGHNYQVKMVSFLNFKRVCTKCGDTKGLLEK